MLNQKNPKEEARQAAQVVLRAVMIDGAALPTLGAPLAIAVVWGAVSFVVALKIFRWR